MTFVYICNCQLLGMQIEICHICCKLVSCKLGMEVDDFGAILRCGRLVAPGPNPSFTPLLC